MWQSYQINVLDLRELNTLPRSKVLVPLFTFKLDANQSFCYYISILLTLGELSYCWWMFSHFKKGINPWIYIVSQCPWPEEGDTYAVLFVEVSVQRFHRALPPVFVIVMVTIKQGGPPRVKRSKGQDLIASYVTLTWHIHVISFIYLN